MKKFECVQLQLSKLSKQFEIDSPVAVGPPPEQDAEPVVQHEVARVHVELEHLPVVPEANSQLAPLRGAVLDLVRRHCPDAAPAHREEGRHAALRAELVLYPSE